MLLMLAVGFSSFGGFCFFYLFFNKKKEREVNVSHSEALPLPKWQGVAAIEGALLSVCPH